MRPIYTRAIITNRSLPPPTERMVEIVRFVYHYRVVTTEQIEARFFNQWVDRDGVSHQRNPNIRSTQCKLITSRLYHEYKYLVRYARPQVPTDGRLPLVYFLDTKGAELLAERDGVDPKRLDWDKGDNRVKWLFLEHLLATNDVRLALELSADKHGYTLLSWQDDRALRKAKRIYVTLEKKTAQGTTPERVAVIPDGYGVVQVGERAYPLFVETDMGTVTGMSEQQARPDFYRKVVAYRTLRHSGLFTARFGHETFRVLTVTTSDKRLANLVKAAEKAGAGFTYYFTTHDRIKRGRGSYADALVEPLWQSPGREGLRAVLPQSGQADTSSPH